jgi:hypothetical protein
MAEMTERVGDLETAVFGAYDSEKRTYIKGLLQKFEDLMEQIAKVEKEKADRAIWVRWAVGLGVLILTSGSFAAIASFCLHLWELGVIHK